MKYVVLVGDGMADYPVDELGGRTPLEVARIPNMDDVTGWGQLGLVRTVPLGFTPASDVALLSIFGYDPKRYYSGRAPMEAAQLGIKMGPEVVAFRCNLITADNGHITDYSAGHIGNSEARDLIGFLGQQLGDEHVSFHAGVGYRHICVIGDIGLTKVDCTPPHDVIGEPVSENLPRGEGAERLVRLMEDSYELLSKHDINQARIERGENPANMIWLWGQGQAHSLPSFRERFGLDGGVISAVDLVKGMARLIGLEPIDVPGATGYYDTDYEAKARYALECLDKEAFVLVHVEAPDEAGHNGDLGQKIKAIENFDRYVVGTIKERVWRQPAFRMLVLPDHPTPLAVRTHTSDPVPFAWCGSGIEGDGVVSFNERNAAASTLQFVDGHELMPQFVKQ